MKRVIFHAGLPKTGSTSIQHMLRDRAEECASEGVGVIAAKTITRPACIAARRFLEDDVTAPLRLLEYRLACRRIRREIEGRGHAVTILSDENILGLASRSMFAIPYGPRLRRIVQVIVHTFRRYDLRIVLYNRDPAAMHRSALKQRWKRGEQITEAEWNRRFPDKGVPARMIEALKADHPDRVTILRMEDEIGEGRYLGKAVLDLAGLSHIGPPAQSYWVNAGSVSGPPSEVSA